MPAVSINSSTGELDLHGYSPTIISLTGSGTLINSSVSSTSTLTLSPTSGTSTFSGVITNGAGTVALTVRGAGTVVLAGSNTYTGPTTISAGTLQIGSGGTSGSINGASTVTDNSLLAFDLSGTMTLSAAISGGGGLSQMCPSLLILTGSNTYSGQTTISAGTLQIGNGGTTGSIGSTSGVGDNAALAFDLSTAATFSQTVTGSGGLMQLGPSVLTLTGSNTYTGLTTIASGGTLQIGNGTTGSINSTSSVTDNGLLVFDTSSGTFSKNVSGSGGLTQMASSVLNLGGVNSYSGPTTMTPAPSSWAAIPPWEIPRLFRSTLRSPGPRQLLADVRLTDRQRHGDQHRRQRHLDPHADAGVRLDRRLHRHHPERLGHGRLDP